jgi:hypothetical protein
MRSRHVRLLLTLLLVVTAVPLLTAAGKGNGGNSDAARAEHQRIVEFWTPERVAQAVPRDFVFDPGTGRFGPAAKPDNPGGGNGNGGGGGGGGGGGDDGTSVVTGASWKAGGEVDGAVGKVLFQMGSSYYVCSATVIDDESASANGSSLILTAAHCVYDESTGQFSSNWMFIPDYDAQPEALTTSGSFCADTAYGCWTAEKMVVHNGYATAGGFNDQAVLYDFAVVRVGLGGFDDDGDGFGDHELDHVVAEQGYSFGSVGVDGSTSGYAFGYPAEKKYKGNDLIYCSGPIDGDPYNADLTYRMNGCKLNGGSSGGGWFAPFDDTRNVGSGTLVSVNSYGYGGINAMHGPILNGDTADVYAAAKAAGGSTTVGTAP